MHKKMTFSRIVIASILTLSLALAGQTFAGSSCSGSKPDLVTTAVEAGDFNTLVAAVKAAGLAEVLQGDGPFTVFAPSDEAFAKLPAGTVEALLEPENKDQLVAILTYHVVSGDIRSYDVKPGHVQTLQGSEATISKKKDVLMVDQATIIATDIVTSNGVIHVIDQVIMPNSLRAATSADSDTMVARVAD
jgi:uncharacterized surface protein with fasciclin (FAS1) repeats